jgi:hypothetical protein
VAFAPYVTFDEFADWTQLGGTAKQSVVEDVNVAVTRAIDDYCQRHFWQDGTVGTPVARTLEACSYYSLDLPAFHDLTAAAVPTVKTDEAGDGTFEVTWAASDYQLLPFSRPTGRPYTCVEAIAGRLFPVRYSANTGRRDRVQITGVWGWDAVPDSVKQACLIKSAKVFARHQSPQGVAGVGDFGPIRISRFEDPDVVSFLDPYRRTAVLVA